MSYRLTETPDGLRIASEHLPGVESVTLCVSYHVGARAETDAQHGIAHLLEHMAFKGTATRNARQIAEQFDDIGGHCNAYTSMEQTVYYARVLNRHLPVAVEILADILNNSLFDATELKREQEVIVQEIGMHHDTPEDLVFDYLHDVVWPDHPLGRTILGTPHSVRGFTSDDLRHYMRTHYHAPSMVISAAGNVEHEALAAMIGEHFDEITAEAAQETHPASFRSGEKRVARDELEQTQVMLAFPGVAIGDADYYPLQLLSTIFGGGMSSRLFQEVREHRGLAYSVQSFLTSYSDCGLFGIYAGTSPDKTKELVQVLREEAQKIVQGVTKQELVRAKHQQAASLLMRRESVTSVAEWIARHLQDYGAYRPATEMIRTIEAITVEDLMRSSARIFKDTPTALATLGPTKG